MVYRGTIDGFDVEFAVSDPDPFGLRHVVAVQFTHPDGAFEAFAPTRPLPELPEDPNFRDFSLKAA